MNIIVERVCVFYREFIVSQFDMYTTVCVCGKVVDDDDYQMNEKRRQGPQGWVGIGLREGGGGVGLQLWTVWHLGFDPVGGRGSAVFYL